MILALSQKIVAAQQALVTIIFDALQCTKDFYLFCLCGVVYTKQAINKEKIISKINLCCKRT